MCFYVDENHTDLRIAKKDITCYKYMYFRGKKWITPYQAFIYEPGILVTVNTGWRALNKRGCSQINKGLHSHSTRKEAVHNMDSSEHILIECIIPKGAKYFYSKENEEYVSNQLIAVKRIPKRIRKK